MDEDKCRCTFAQRMLGDGCEECQGKTTCTATERAFLDEIREKGFADNDVIYVNGTDSVLLQSDFKTNLKELVNE